MCIYEPGIEACIYLMPGARTVICRMVVLPAEAGIQRLKSLDPGQKHAGMTIKWDSNASDLQDCVFASKAKQKVQVHVIINQDKPHTIKAQTHLHS